MRLSGSKLALLPFCQYFARDDVAHYDTTSRYAIVGRAGHTAGELRIQGKPVDLRAIFDQYGLTESEREGLTRSYEHARDFIDKNKNWSWRAEVAFAYNFETGEGVELPKGEYHRDYRQCPAGFVPMTLDVVGITQVEVDEVMTPCAFVLDWKFGYGEQVAPPRENGQLCGQALAVAAAMQSDLVLVVVAHVREDGIELRESLFDAVTLAAAQREGLERIALIPTATPQPGPHCAGKWCPAISTCPETVRAIESAAATAIVVPTPFRLSTNIDSDEHADWMIDAVAAVRKALEFIDGALEEYADAHPGGGIPRKHGGRWGKAIQTPESIDLAVTGAIEALEAMGLGDKIKSSTSWKALGKRAGDAREVLRALGALKKSTRTVYEDRKVG